MHQTFMISIIRLVQRIEIKLLRYGNIIKIYFIREKKLKIFSVHYIGASPCNGMRFNNRGKKRGGEKKKARKRGYRRGRGRRGAKKVQPNAERKMQKEKEIGNLWVKTCFLGKGLSPSKLSTKALCRDTRKRGNEKPEGNKKERKRACLVKGLQAGLGWTGIPKTVPAPRSSVVTDLQQETDDVGAKAFSENRTQQKRYRRSYRKNLIESLNWKQMRQIIIKT